MGTGTLTAAIEEKENILPTTGDVASVQTMTAGEKPKNYGYP